MELGFTAPIRTDFWLVSNVFPRRHENLMICTAGLIIFSAILRWNFFTSVSQTNKKFAILQLLKNVHKRFLEKNAPIVRKTEIFLDGKKGGKSAVECA